MHTLTDKRGRTWHLDMTPAVVAQVLDRFDVNLVDHFGTHAAMRSCWRAIAVNSGPMCATLLNTLLVMCEPQFPEYGIEGRDFVNQVQTDYHGVGLQLYMVVFRECLELCPFPATRNYWRAVCRQGNTLARLAQAEEA